MNTKCKARKELNIFAVCNTGWHHGYSHTEYVFYHCTFLIHNWNTCPSILLNGHSLSINIIEVYHGFKVDSEGFVI